MVGYKTQVQGRGQGYENLGTVYLEMALKAMRFDENTGREQKRGKCLSCSIRDEGDEN